MSKLEDKIALILKLNNIHFEKEFKFNNLKKKDFLRFDFAIFNKYNQLVCLIEVDGEQHFKNSSFFYKKESDFKKALARDRLKNRYCLINNLKLIRIPFDKIENISTLEDIFLTQSFYVSDINHNDKIRIEKNYN
jgi:hypothetical protein